MPSIMSSTPLHASHATKGLPMLLAALGLALAASSAPAAQGPASIAPAVTAQAAARQADFGREQAAAEVRAVADWVARSRDNGAAPFLIVDKRHARLFVFDAGAHLVANAPILLGSAKGDDSVPGIGDRKIADIRPDERTTPA